MMNEWLFITQQMQNCQECCQWTARFKGFIFGQECPRALEMECASPATAKGRRGSRFGCALSSDKTSPHMVGVTRVSYSRMTTKYSRAFSCSNIVGVPSSDRVLRNLITKFMIYTSG